MTKILLIGNEGQLGQELEKMLVNTEHNLISTNQDFLDLTQPDQIKKIIRENRPEIIINCAAYTAVDKAETEQELAHQINSIALSILAQEAEQIGAYLIHISTDYVFDGNKGYPYQETDPTNPIGSYGKTKLAGEQEIQKYCKLYLIIRTAWVYGVYGKINFVKTMLRLGEQREEIRVVADQIGSPTWTKDLADAIINLIPKLSPEIVGIYHYTNSGVASWYDFAIAIFEEAAKLGFNLKIQQVIPITTAEYPTPAKRPAYSVLSTQKISQILGTFPPHWRQSLRAMLTSYQPEKL